MNTSIGLEGRRGGLRKGKILDADEVLYFVFWEKCLIHDTLLKDVFT